MTDEQMLAEQLAAGKQSRPPVHNIGIPMAVNEQSHPNIPSADFSQWQCAPNRCFRPTGSTVATLPSAYYYADSDPLGLFLRAIDLSCDSIVALPDGNSPRLLQSIRTFWASENLYRQHGLLFKRGILLWGPPGGGKTITVTLLIRELLAAGGIVLEMRHPQVMAMALSAIRAIEPTRPLIIVFEDIDEIVNRYGESEILSLLDGEHRVDNVVHLATTNYPERLGSRIVNRPSRFDERIMIGMPSTASRLAYLRQATSNGGPHSQIQRWADDTEGLSIAHLRELVAAVFCLGQSYESVLNRLKSMAKRPKDVEGFAHHNISLS